MSGSRFHYQHQKMSQARSALMLAHTSGVAHSIASAFFSCNLALEDLNIDDIEDESVRIWIATIERMMDTTGIEDPTGEGTYLERARQMTPDDQMAFSKAVDELTDWFHREFWSAA